MHPEVVVSLDRHGNNLVGRSVPGREMQLMLSWVNFTRAIVGCQCKHLRVHRNGQHLCSTWRHGVESLEFDQLFDWHRVICGCSCANRLPYAVIHHQNLISSE